MNCELANKFYDKFKDDENINIDIRTDKRISQSTMLLCFREQMKLIIGEEYNKFTGIAFSNNNAKYDMWKVLSETLKSFNKELE